MSNDVYPALIKGLGFTVMKSPEFNTTVGRSASGSEVRVQNYANPIWHWQLLYGYLYDNSSSANNRRVYGYSDLQTLMGFFLARGGQFDDFLFDDPDDNLVTAAPQQIVGDGAGSWYTPLQRNMGGGFLEDITDLNTATALVVTANGNTTTDFDVDGIGLSLPGASFGGMYLAWSAWAATTAYVVGQIFIDAAGHAQKVTTAGTSGGSLPTFNDAGSTTTDGSVTWTDQGTALISATFQFYFRVRFASDSEDFEKFMADLWAVGGSQSKNGKGMIELVSSRPPMSGVGSGFGMPIPGALLSPPAGKRLVILYPWKPNPPTKGLLFGSLALTGSDGSLTGQFSAVGTGAGGGIGLGKGSISRSVDASPSTLIVEYRLPPFVAKAKVTNVWAVVSGTKKDSPVFAPAPITLVPTSFDEHALIQLGLLGAVGGTTNVGGPVDNTFKSYLAEQTVIVLAPSSDVRFWLDPTAVPFESLGLSATLELTLYGRCNCEWSGGMSIAVWYTP